MRINFKNVALCIACLAVLTVSSGCGKEDPELPVQEDTPGKIAGLGETEGEPTGTPFQFPQGIEPADKMRGGYLSFFYGRSAAADKRAMLKTMQTLRAETARTRADGESFTLDRVVGSGVFVTIFVPLRNTTSRDITVDFPAGLIAKSVSGYCQNGVLLKKTSVRVSAGSVCGVLLLMYCGNAHRDPSEYSEEYVFAAVSNSSLIVDLCDRLKNKRINNEDYPVEEDGYTYSGQYTIYVSVLQAILWKLTDDGEALSEEEIELIEGMENV